MITQKIFDMESTTKSANDQTKYYSYDSSDEKCVKSLEDSQRILSEEYNEKSVKYFAE